ncbi:MAG: Acryloyl-CoA reductase AcuI/YhdH [uncultured Thermomicrobiales bacterium]|uniref:Acryloyl-CoA reductase AcuI/YhdH n=1 Tax=uncultured Thermomicrobiales bacterium TaxID=1645740 RepID=A0A6J4UW25_9BACT|nr:MAG: Acryloyl-CoA reductase AcuI/YhdH [uncultured Thermomicrobiales bacterium]
MTGANARPSRTAAQRGAMERFKALVLEEQAGKVTTTISDLPRAALPEGEVTVRVAYSTLNYKDALAITGRGKIVRAYPMVPGIDFAGTVEESASPEFAPGDQVVLTGWGVGERHWGGLAEYARVKAAWLTRLPEGLTLQGSMGFGTAGLTAALCVLALEEAGVVLSEREVVVTGATGGVGSIAVALLARAGFNVTASTGRAAEHDYLRRLGARQIIDREELAAPSKRPLDSERWAGGIDTVGGATLAAILRATAYTGAVAACGLAGGTDLPTTVFPFILRGVRLLGVDSVLAAQGRREAAWARLARDFPAELLAEVTRTVPLAEAPALAAALLDGGVRGRIVVDIYG